jgi:16S rRNA G1207 methylase RsmC
MDGKVETLIAAAEEPLAHDGGLVLVAKQRRRTGPPWATAYHTVLGA